MLHVPKNTTCLALDGFKSDSNSGNEAPNPGDGELPISFMIRVHLQSLIPFSMMIPMPICIHRQRRQKHVDPTLKRRLIHGITAQALTVNGGMEHPDCCFMEKNDGERDKESVRNNGAIAREQSARSARKNGAIVREESTGSSRKNGAIMREELDGSTRNNGAIAREELARSAKNYGAIPREESARTARNYGAITREESGTSESGGS
ncbi:hypothetical protein CFP56_022275 [Quercus suber]|uniref:Uncharacterized protein n=1 Tax=Quercus suber TaxID=58331 RepID=A0AAW0KDP4_QUESU